MKKSFKRSLSILLSALLICSMAFSLQIKPVIAEDAGITDEVSFYENLSESDFTEDNTITVLIEFDYPENDYDVRDTDSLESSQEQLRLLRASNRAYYTENNQEFIDDLDIEYDDMDVSAYSPYVFVTFDTWAEYTDARDDLIELSEDSKVKRVFAEETPVADEESVHVNNSVSTEEMSMDDARKLIGVKNEDGSNVSEATGAGIRVGIIERGHPHDTLNFPVGTIAAIRDSVQQSSHATTVASILGGIYGIAPEVEFYFAGPFTQDAVEWLIDNQVNIINVSDGYGYTGYYTGYDLYTDYISHSNCVLFVKSAGNQHPENNPNKMISNPGLGLNVLTVGCVDKNKNISSTSSYDVSDAVEYFIKKPTFVAPGECIEIPGADLVNLTSGTSLSAPMVTGIAALLMDEFNFLINYPELLASALINGCELLPGQTNIWEQYAGFGIVNYKNTRNILLEQRYLTCLVTNGDSNEDSNGDSTEKHSATVLLETSVYLAPNESVKLCLFNVARQLLNNEVLDIFDTDALYTQYTPSITQYCVEICNSPSGIDCDCDNDCYSNSESNILCLNFTNSDAGGTYYIKVYMHSEKRFGSSEYLALTYSTTHEHSYTHHYVKKTRLNHASYCGCGDYVIEPHVFMEIFGETRTCGDCGYAETIG